MGSTGGSWIQFNTNLESTGTAAKYSPICTSKWMVVPGEQGSNDCPAGSSMITSEAMCRQASQSAVVQGHWSGVSFDDNVRGYSHVQAGCISTGGNWIQFNTNLESTGTAATYSPICMSKLIFVLGEEGSNDCPAGSSMITSEAMCRRAS